jgi:hypothetical protein
VINENQYKFICNKLHKILQRKDFGIEIFCVPWMHIIRAHPIVLKRYTEIFHIQNPIKYFVYNIKKNLQVFLNHVLIAKKSFFCNSNYFVGHIDKDQHFEYLFVSHLLNKHQINQSNDFYFEDISDKLKLKGLNSIFAYIPQFNYNENDIYKSNKFKNNILFTKSLSFIDEFKIRFNLFKSSKKLLQIPAEDEIDRRILKRIMWEFMSIGSQTNMRLIKQFEYIIKLIKPKYIVIPYEGHGYERIIFSVVNKIDSNILCIAYQHTGLFKYSNAIFNFYSNNLNPSIILTSGIHGFEKINKYNSNIPLGILGSYRGVSENIVLSTKKSNKKCIVIPEGFINECVNLFEFSLLCAIKLPDIEFIWRLHPSISFEEIFLLNPSLKKIPNNIILSSNSIETDIADSQWALYRGSTAIFKIIASGARPVYLNTNEEVSIDPLYDFDGDIRKNVTNPDEFVKIVKIDKSKNEIFTIHNLKIIKEYCEKRFSKLNYEILLPENIARLNFENGK